MKEIRRDFTAIIQVPDDVNIEDCEVLMTMAEASYRASSSVLPIDVLSQDISIIAEDPYVVEPEPPPVPRPKCPKCWKKIDRPYVNWEANIPGIASVVDGELHIDIMDEITLTECIVEDTATYGCPECGVELFKTGEEDKMEEFLKTNQLTHRG